MARIVGASRRGSVAVTMALGVVLASPAARAQLAVSPVQAAPKSDEIPDIVVTAQRREERLQDVPISITAFSTERLAEAQVNGVSDLGHVAAGVAVVQALNPTAIKINIRGISELVPSIAYDPATGVYIDEVYYVLNPGADLALLDMERVEVLKGPQGTLFGRNTIAGALNITTKKPTDRFEGAAEIGYGNYDSLTATAIVNIPISDSLSTRFVYNHREHDGYGRNTFLDVPISEGNQDYVRGTLRFEPTNALSVTASGYYSSFNGSQSAAHVTFVNPAIGLSALAASLQGRPGDSLANYVGQGGFYDNQSNIDPPTTLEVYGGTLNAVLKGDAFSVKSVTGYTHTAYDVGVDLDGSPIAVLNTLLSRLRARQVSQEFQVFGDALDNRLRWIGGVYFFRETGSEETHVMILPPIITPPNQYQLDGPTVRNTSYAAYAQLTYEVAAGLRLTGGIRYTRDQRRSDFRSSNRLLADDSYVRCGIAPLPVNSPEASCSATFRAKYHYFPFTVGLDYKPSNDTLLYAKLSRGFRSGAIPLTAPTPANANFFGAVSPERLLSPEVGVKTELLDRKLRLSAALFYSAYDNVQQSQNVPDGLGGFVNVLRNAGSGHIYGGEFEASAAIQKLRLDASLGLVEPKFTSGPFKIDGQPFPNVSKVNWSLTGTYPIETAIGVLTLNSTYSWRSRLYFFPYLAGSALDAKAISQKAYGLLDAQIALAVRGTGIRVTGWAKNLLAKKYYNGGADLAGTLGFTEKLAATPRTYGVSARYDF